MVALIAKHEASMIIREIRCQIVLLIVSETFDLICLDFRYSGHVLERRRCGVEAVITDVRMSYNLMSL